MDVKIECSNSTHYSGKHRNCRRCCLPDRTALASSNTHDNEGRIESSVLTLNDSEGAERKIWLCLVVEKDLRQRFISRVWLIVHRHEACTLPLSKASECKQTVHRPSSHSGGEEKRPARKQLFRHIFYSVFTTITAETGRWKPVVVAAVTDIP